MQYVRKIVRCGRVCYVSEHPAPARGKNRNRPPAVQESSEAQKKLNDKSAARKLAWKILCNFIPHRDVFVTLTSGQDDDEAEARRKRRRFLEAMRKYWRGKGQELKYIIVTEKQARWHHHIIMQNTPLEVIRDCWEKIGGGRVMVSPLDPFDDYQGLAEYLVGPEKPHKPGRDQTPKAPRRKGQQRYSCSRNLREPEIEVKELKRIPKGEPRPPKGYIVKEWNLWADEWGDLHREYRCVWCGQGDPPVRGKRRKRE